MGNYISKDTEFLHPNEVNNDSFKDSDSDSSYSATVCSMREFDDTSESSTTDLGIGLDTTSSISTSASVYSHGTSGTTSSRFILGPTVTRTGFFLQTSTVTTTAPAFTYGTTPMSTTPSSTFGFGTPAAVSTDPVFFINLAFGNTARNSLFGGFSMPSNLYPTSTTANSASYNTGTQFQMPISVTSAAIFNLNFAFGNPPHPGSNSLFGGFAMPSNEMASDFGTITPPVTACNTALSLEAVPTASSASTGFAFITTTAPTQFIVETSTKTTPSGFNIGPIASTSVAPSKFTSTASTTALNEHSLATNSVAGITSSEKSSSPPAIFNVRGCPATATGVTPVTGLNFGVPQFASDNTESQFQMPTCTKATTINSAQFVTKDELDAEVKGIKTPVRRAFSHVHAATTKLGDSLCDLKEELKKTKAEYICKDELDAELMDIKRPVQRAFSHVNSTTTKIEESLSDLKEELKKTKENQERRENYLQHQIQDLQEENNFLKLKVEILLNMFSGAVVETEEEN